MNTNIPHTPMPESADRQVAIRDLERSLNNAIMVFGHTDIQMRVALMRCRRVIREAMLKDNA